MNNQQPDTLRKTHLVIVFALTFARAPLVIAAGAASIINVFYPSPVIVTTTILLMCASALTDLFDGKYARKWDVTSRLGALADPLMDKIFYGITLPAATFVALVNEDLPHAIILLLLDVVSIVRDLWVTFMRSAALEYGADIKAGMIGKIRTAFGFPVIAAAHLYLGAQTLSMQCEKYEGLTLFPFSVLAAAELVFLALTVVSAIVYTTGYLPYLKRAASTARQKQ